jgi:hypothetical protein
MGWERFRDESQSAAWGHAAYNDMDSIPMREETVWTPGGALQFALLRDRSSCNLRRNEGWFLLE